MPQFTTALENALSEMLHKQESTPKENKNEQKITPIDNNAKTGTLWAGIQAVYGFHNFVLSSFEKDKKILEELYKLLVQIRTGKKAAHANNINQLFKQAMKIPKGEWGRQQAADEALYQLLNGIHKWGETAQLLYAGEHIKKFVNLFAIQQTVANQTSSTNGLRLTILPKKISNVQEALTAYLHDKSNGLIANNNTPEILTLTLGVTDLRGKKIKKSFKIDKKITFNNANYTLKSMVVHHGEALNSGHYTAYTETHCCNDLSVTPTKNFGGLCDCKNDIPYILFYEKKQPKVIQQKK